jgi:hypothetical protein
MESFIRIETYVNTLTSGKLKQLFKTQSQFKTVQYAVYDSVTDPHHVDAAPAPTMKSMKVKKQHIGGGGG